MTSAQTASPLSALSAGLHGLRGGLVWSIAGVGALVTIGFTAAMLVAAVVATAKPETVALSIDFKVFWAAGQLLLDGEPLAVLDATRLSDIHRRVSEVWMPWLYPPGYLLLMAPFGLLSFSGAFLLSTGVSLLALILACRPYVLPNSAPALALAFAPAFLPSLMIGQNSLLWLAVLVFALTALRSGHWLLAGVCIGCLTLKPQLGLMIPFALLGLGAWRVILAATVTAILVAILPTLVVGTGYWPPLLANMSQQSANLLTNSATLDLLVGPLSFLTRLGLPSDIAFGLQACLAAFAAVAVVMVWRSAASFDVKSATLLLAALIATPFLWYYEAAAMPLVALFMLRGGVLSLRPLHLLLTALLWIGPGLLAISRFLDLGGDEILGVYLITPTLLVSFLLCLRHVLGTARGTGGATVNTSNPR